MNLIGGQPHGSDPIGQWYIPNGSTLALQQLLAQLGYLPLDFTPTNPNDIASTPGAEEAAIVNPPQGSFSWRYPNTPDAAQEAVVADRLHGTHQGRRDGV